MTTSRNWEYSHLALGGRGDIWFARLQAMGAEGWEAFAATASDIWLKRPAVSLLEKDGEQ